MGHIIPQIPMGRVIENIFLQYLPSNDHKHTKGNLTHKAENDLFK
jgi:hypothetical protein